VSAATDQQQSSLDRARAALAAARELDPGDIQYQDLLVIANVQAQVAQAAALERIAVVLERRLPSPWAGGPR
jgi:hypothetical protein